MTFSDPLPESRHPSTEDTIKRVAPKKPGIVFFWDKGGDFWFVELTEDIHGLLMSIRENPSHPRRQGIEFAFEVWLDSKEREARWHYVLYHFKPTGQDPKPLSRKL
jgi:hypothetical protein